MGTMRAVSAAFSIDAGPRSDREAEAALQVTIASYDRSAEDYAARFASARLDVAIERFLELLPPRPCTVLDAGCGSGRDLEELRLRGVPAVGIDLSQGLLAEARRRTTAPLVLADLRRLPFPDRSMEGVWACASLVHLNDAAFARALDELARVTKEGGAIFISVRPGVGTEWRADAHGGQRLFYLHNVDEMYDLLSQRTFGSIDVQLEEGFADTKWVNAYAVASR